MNEERTALDWEARFRAGDAPWERPGLHPALRQWRETGRLKPGARIIVPGCGRAPEVEAYARLGLKVTGADLSTTALAWQAERLAAAGLEAELVEGDVLAYRPGAPFDLVHEQTFLCAIPPRLRADYEAAVHAWLKPGGALLALFMQKEERGGPPYGCAPEAMRDLFPEARWRWPEEGELVAYPHPSLGGKPELGGVLLRR
ncbi:methyltransferase domain-containing protein [Maricaulis sp. CAU 1757]